MINIVSDKTRIKFNSCNDNVYCKWLMMFISNRLNVEYTDYEDQIQELYVCLDYNLEVNLLQIWKLNEIRKFIFHYFKGFFSDHKVNYFGREGESV